MKANEFVKQHGWGAAKYKADELKIFKGLGGELSVEDAHLMRLVESWELVESVGGWSNATALYDEHLDKDLGRSIADVESCQ